MYQWHRKQYVGAAHGVAGIYYMLMQVRVSSAGWDKTPVTPCFASEDLFSFHAQAVQGCGRSEACSWGSDCSPELCRDASQGPRSRGRLTYPSVQHCDTSNVAARPPAEGSALCSLLQSVSRAFCLHDEDVHPCPTVFYTICL